MSLARTFRQWRTRDRAWVGRLAARLGTVRVEGCRFRVDSPLISDELKCRLFYARYELTERAMLRRHLPSALPVIELGGGMGVVASIVNSRLRDPSRHVVVEANPGLLQLLADNRALNAAGFEIVHGAIAYHPDVAILPGADMLGTTTSSSGGGEAVPAVTFREIVERSGFDTCVVICDIEGAEVELVEHDIESLRRHACLIVLEAHPEYTSAPVRQRMFETLAAAGFVTLETLRKVTVLANVQADSILRP